MKTFHFPLQAVLDWRGRTVEQEQSHLQRLHGSKAEATRRREEVQTELRDVEQAMVEGPVAAHDLFQLAKYASSLQGRGREMRLLEAQCDEKIERQRLKCLDSQRKFRLLEICRTRRLGEWEKGMQAETEATAAGSYLARWARNAQSE